MQEFLSISQLSHGFNVSEKVIRHSFKKLLKEGRLIEGEDFLREDYRDDLHFVYKIHPGRFAALTQLFPAPSPIEPLGTKTADTATQPDSNLGSTNDDAVSQPIEFASKSATTANDLPDDPATTDPRLATTHHNSSEKNTSYLHEYLSSKDEQIAILKDQINDLKSQMNRKDGQLTVQERLIESFHESQNDARHLIRIMTERVVELSKLPLAAATTPTDFGSQLDNKDESSTTHSGNKSDNRDSSFATQTEHSDKTLGTHPAGQGSEMYTEPENFVDTNQP